nr:hypothetical protein [Tanacetum cinerariifolium]
MSSSTVTYTSISSDSDLPPWGFHLMDPNEFEAPQSPKQAPPSPDYVPGPEYPEYAASSNDEIPVEDQPLLADASPTALSPSYVADFDPEEDLEEDPADYPVDGEMMIKRKGSPPRMTRLRRTRKNVRPWPPITASTKALIAEYASAPTPPSPPPSLLSPLSSLVSMISSSPIHTSPTYVSAPLGYRAVMVQLRAASPLHVPSPPLPVPSPPLLLPPVDRKSGILETYMSFQNRLCLTASASRVMTAVEEVNKRVTDLATTQRQNAHELYKMPPKKTTTPMIDAAIKQLIAQGVALAKHKANKNSKNGDDHHDSGTGKRRQVYTTRECTYSDFPKCQPLNFKGIEGVVGLTQWIL